MLWIIHHVNAVGCWNVPGFRLFRRERFFPTLGAIKEEFPPPTAATLFWLSRRHLLLFTSGARCAIKKERHMAFAYIYRETLLSRASSSPSALEFRTSTQFLALPASSPSPIDKEFASKFLYKRSRASSNSLSSDLIVTKWKLEKWSGLKVKWDMEKLAKSWK